VTKSDEGVEMSQDETGSVARAAEQAPGDVAEEVAEEVAVEILVEEVSIDGMCGVY
jgi:mycofactocin precursor